MFLHCSNVIMFAVICTITFILSRYVMRSALRFMFDYEQSSTEIGRCQRVAEMRAIPRYVACRSF